MTTKGAASMAAATQELKTITRIERLNLSVNGNPRYKIGFEDGTVANTKSDSAVGYEIGNVNYREGCQVLVTFTRAGRISMMDNPDALTNSGCDECGTNDRTAGSVFCAECGWDQS